VTALLVPNPTWVTNVRSNGTVAGGSGLAEQRLNGTAIGLPHLGSQFAAETISQFTTNELSPDLNNRFLNDPGPPITCNQQF
jgi:hypothetical protein